MEEKKQVRKGGSGEFFVVFSGIRVFLWSFFWTHAIDVLYKYREIVIFLHRGNDFNLKKKDFTDFFCYFIVFLS